MGRYPVGNRIFRCWKEEGHGHLNIEEAIVHSCDVFFYQLGLKIGVDKIIQFARYFGLGEPTGIDLPSEKDGLLPTPSWKKAAKGEAWYPGDTANLSIGQGYILVTPLQMLNSTLFIIVPGIYKTVSLNLHFKISLIYFCRPDYINR